MSWTPTDEQVKRGAVELMRDDPEYENGTYGPEDYEEMARAVLVAVGPTIAAQAQREAAGRMREYIGRDESAPYTQGWNRALEVVADRIEKEAG